MSELKCRKRWCKSTSFNVEDVRVVLQPFGSAVMSSVSCRECGKSWVQAKEGANS